MGLRMGLALLLAVTAARADEDEAPKRHFQQGVTLFKYGDYKGALVEFEASYQAHPAAAILYNIALTERALFRYHDAIAHFRQYLADEPGVEAARRHEVERSIADLEALLTDLTVVVVPDDATVILDGRVLALPRGAVRVAAGEHSLDAAAEGFRSVHRDLTVTAGTPLRATLLLDPLDRREAIEVAIAAYQRHLDAAPAAAEAGEVRGRLRALQERDQALIAAGLPPPPSLPHYRAPLAVGGGALALAAVGAGLLGSVGPGIDEVNRNGCYAPCGALDDLRLRADVGYAVLALAAAVAVVDVVLWARARRGVTAERRTWMAGLRP